MRQTLRKIVAVVALAGLTMNLVPGALAATYTAQAAADKLAASGYIVDQSANPAAYRLADNVLRQEAVGTAANILGILTVPLSDYVCTNKFSDVSSADGWVCRAAELSANAGLTNAANATFRPKDNLTRFEALVFALRAANLVPSGTQTQSSLINIAAEEGVITSSVGFNANALATRGEYFQYLARALDAAAGIDPDTGNGGTSGNVSASLSANQPSGIIVAGQAIAPLLGVNFSGNGTINSITLQRSGISDQNTLSNVYLYDGNVRLSDGYSFNSAGSLTMNGLNIPVSGLKNLWVRADVATGTGAGQTVVISLTGYTVAGAAAATANLTGNTLTTGAAGSLATATLSANTVSAGTVNAGVSSYTFWSAPIQVNTRTVHLQAAGFRLVGSAPSDALGNVKLYIDGVDTGATAGTIVSGGSNYLVFDFGSTPKELTTGSHTVEVRANVEKGSARTVQLSVQNSSDFVVLDPQVGVNIAVAGTPNNAGVISISSGSLTVENDPAFTAQTTVTGGGSNTIIAKFKLHAYGEDVKVQSFNVTSTVAGATPATATLDDVTLYYDGSQVGTQQDSTGAALTFNLGSQVIVPAGADKYLEVRANIRNTSGVNYTAGTIQVALAAGTGNAQGQQSFEALNTPARTANTLTISTGNLAVAKNAAYANMTAAPNTSAVKIGSYVLQNQSTSEAVRVTKIVVGLTPGAGTSLSNFSALYTSENTAPVQPVATNTFSVDFTLAPGATKTIDVFASSGSDTGVTATIDTTATVTSIGVSSNVSTTSAAIAGQTISFGSATLTNPPVFVSTASSNAQYVAAGQTGATDGSKNVYRLTATGGSAKVTELKIAASNSTVSSVRVGTVTAPVVSGVAYLTGLDLDVPTGSSGLLVEVYPTYNTVDNTNGVPSGTTSTLTLTHVKYTSGGTTNTITPSVASNAMTLVASKPTVTLGTLSNQGISVGTKDILKFSVAADAKGELEVDSVSITIGSSGDIDFDTFELLDASGNVISGTTFNVATINDAGAVVITLPAGYTVPAGTTKAFTFRANVASITTAGDTTGRSISAKLTSAATFMWTDIASGSTTSVAGTPIYGYPTSSVTVASN